MKLAAIAAIIFALSGCSAHQRALSDFSSRQKEKIQQDAVYHQAEFEFWGAMYEPTQDDLQELRQSWIAHGEAFPESKAILDLEAEMRKSNQKMVLVSVFMSSYDIADLKDKSRGWAISPVPVRITELSENDAVLRVLMPVRNAWARYFMLQYTTSGWAGASQFVLSDARGRVVFSK